MTIKKQIYLLSIFSLLLLIVLLLFTANTAPNTDTAVPVLVVLLLLYGFCVGVTSLVYVLATGKSWSSRATTIFLLACIPPAFIMIASLRQATVLDMSILMITVVLIVWYATFKK